MLKFGTVEMKGMQDCLKLCVLGREIFEGVQTNDMKSSLKHLDHSLVAGCGTGHRLNKSLKVFLDRFGFN